MSETGQIYSASSIATFLRCGRQWEFAYVYGLKSPPTVRLVVGLAGHEAIELNYRQKLDTALDLPIDVVTDAFSDSFDRMAPDIEEDEDGEKPGQAKDSGIKSVRIYHEKVAPAVQPLMVEEQVSFLLNDIPFSGYIDLVDQARRVRDAKFTGKRPGKNDYALNMIGYAVGFRQKTGEQETGVQLDYVVRTQKPYYWPVPSEGPVPDTAIRQFASIVSRVDKAVQAGSFLPTGLNTGACSWCGYRTFCPDLLRTRGK